MSRDFFRGDPFFSTGGFNDFPDADRFFNDRLEPRSNRREERRRERNGSDQTIEPFHGGGMMDVFGSMNQMMSQMQRHFSDVQQQMQHAESNPNGHCYSSSTFYSYDGRGKEPHVYQAHSSTLRGPGGIKETRKAVKDSRSGEEKMAIGQHIYDRGIVREKRRNRKTNEEDENEELHGIEHEEIPHFQRDWKSKVSRHHAIGASERRPEGRHGKRDARALPDSRRH